MKAKEGNKGRKGEKLQEKGKERKGPKGKRKNRTKRNITKSPETKKKYITTPYHRILKARLETCSKQFRGQRILFSVGGKFAHENC